MKMWHIKKTHKHFFLSIMLCTGFALCFEAQAENTLPLAQAEYRNLPVKRYLDATIEAVHQATMSAQTTGRITEILVDIDDNVTKGMVMIKLRDNDQRAAFKAAKGNLLEAESENTRNLQLYDQKLIAKAILDKSVARLKTAKAEYEKTQEELNNTIIKAPYSGIVVKRHVEVGEMARTGYPLITGLSLEKLRATVEVPQSLIHLLRKQKTVSVLVNAENNQLIESESITISPYADSNSHTFTMRLNLPDGDYGLYPGMFVKVILHKGERPHLLIPASAVLQRGEVTVVYVSDKQQQLVLRHVRAGQKIPAADIAGLADSTLAQAKSAVAEQKTETDQSVPQEPVISPVISPETPLETPPETSPQTPDVTMALETTYVEILSGLEAGDMVVLDPIRATELIKQQQLQTSRNEKP